MGRREPTMGRGRGLGELPRSPNEQLEPARAPEPPSRRQHSDRRYGFARLLRVANGSLTFLLMTMIALGVLFVVFKYQFDRTGPLDHSTVVVISKGAGVNAIARLLAREGIIDDSRIFVASVLYFRAQQKLKAGEYEIRKHASMRQVLDRLVEGRAVLHKVTVPEGFTSQMIVARLMGQSDLTGKVGRVPPEGSLLPDTYKFSRGTSRDDLLERMTAAQRKFAARLWQTRASGLPFRTLEEAIILASIVEKETRRADERARVAAVFVNRLKKGMRLQSDPTIIYGLVGGKGRLGRPILRSDINQRTPYNTYYINGLPPTPICNPGRAAIEAVLNPVETGDLFFVADGTGGHVFAASAREHRRNVQRWRKIERATRVRAREEAAAGRAATDASAVATAAPGPVGGAIAIRGLVVSGVPVGMGAVPPASSPRAGVAAPEILHEIPLPVMRPRR